MEKDVRKQQGAEGHVWGDQFISEYRVIERVPATEKTAFCRELQGKDGAAAHGRSEVDEFECSVREGEELDSEDIENAAYCLINKVPYAGFGEK